MAKRKLTKADLERHERMTETARRLRELAEKGQAELDRKKREAEAAGSA